MTTMPTAALSRAALCLFALGACVEDGAWYTPADVPLGEIDCTSPAPLDGPSGKEICLARIIAETPQEIARCKRDGGVTGPISGIDRRFSCNYRIKNDNPGFGGTGGTE